MCVCACVDVCIICYVYVCAPCILYHVLMWIRAVKTKLTQANKHERNKTHQHTVTQLIFPTNKTRKKRQGTTQNNTKRNGTNNKNTHKSNHNKAKQNNTKHNSTTPKPQTNKHNNTQTN